MSDSRKTGLVLLPEQAEHDTGDHPENGRRIPAVLEHLRQAPEWSRLALLESRRARPEDIIRVHTPEHFELIESRSAAGPSWIDGDTPVSTGSFEVALRAAGGALVGIDSLLGDSASRPDSLFALIRPPGHHATPGRAMGFCLFNNAAIAARYAQECHGVERVAILDWDVHHGNGTQDAFWDDPSVMVVSLHQWPLYPGTGWLVETGAGEGEGTTVNLPMPPGCGDREYLEAMVAVVEPTLEAFDPGLLIVSAGQDGHVADPLSDEAITAAGYNRLAARSASLARRLGIGLLAVHEGGYNLATLPGLDRAILAGFGDYPAELDEPEAGRARLSGSDPGWDERRREIVAAQRPYRQLG
ncbi:MAG: histone deacetylase [Solirubrobacterales bacterium]|nr:histone deacetylase [Solirubrobacterales bacterium]